MTHFERLLAKRLGELSEEKTFILTHTVLPQTEYHIQMGYMQCLRDIEALLVEIRKEINEG